MLFDHLCCWKIVRRSQPSRSYLDFYWLMRQLHHIIPRTRVVSRELWDMASFQDCGTHMDPGSWLSRCVRLPQELQWLVLQHVPRNSLAFCLLAAYQCAGLLWQFNPLISAPVHSLKSFATAGFIGIVWLYATYVQISGRTYIRHIHSSSHSEQPATSCLRINGNNVQSLRFVVGLMGVSAIRLAHRDGSFSDWLGDPRYGWHGSTLSFNACDLQVSRDGPLGYVDMKGTHGIAVHGKQHDFAVAGYQIGYPMYCSLNAAEDIVRIGLVMYEEADQIYGPFLLLEQKPRKISVDIFYSVPYPCITTSTAIGNPCFRTRLMTQDMWSEV